MASKVASLYTMNNPWMQRDIAAFTKTSTSKFPDFRNVVFEFGRSAENAQPKVVWRREYNQSRCKALSSSSTRVTWRRPHDASSLESYASPSDNFSPMNVVLPKTISEKKLSGRIRLHHSGGDLPSYITKALEGPKYDLARYVSDSVLYFDRNAAERACRKQGALSHPITIWYDEDAKSYHWFASDYDVLALRTSRSNFTQSNTTQIMASPLILVMAPFQSYTDLHFDISIAGLYKASEHGALAFDFARIISSLYIKGLIFESSGIAHGPLTDPPGISNHDVKGIIELAKRLADNSASRVISIEDTKSLASISGIEPTVTLCSAEFTESFEPASVPDAEAFMISQSGPSKSGFSRNLISNVGSSSKETPPSQRDGGYSFDDYMFDNLFFV